MPKNSKLKSYIVTIEEINPYYDAEIHAKNKKEAIKIAEENYEGKVVQIEELN